MHMHIHIERGGREVGREGREGGREVGRERREGREGERDTERETHTERQRETTIATYRVKCYFVRRSVNTVTLAYPINNNNQSDFNLLLNGHTSL